MTTFGFDHIERMSDRYGLYEHAALTVRRREHGYCTDDNARLLVVATRDGGDERAQHLSRRALAFVLDAQTRDGSIRNRMDRSGRWTDTASTEDCWGRAMWGLGVTATAHADPDVRRQALRGFDRGVGHRSQSSRTMAFAALGASDVLYADTDHVSARALLLHTLAIVGPLGDASWRWPEPRLRYANAALAEAVIAAGAATGDIGALDKGLAMLAWLLDQETRDGHLSVTGSAGRGRHDAVGPQFDQQPIEVSSMADACWRAYTVTEDRAWLHGVELAAAWFAGSNDVGLVMYDRASGGGYDGLHESAVNRNQGAESTLAFISTMQRARSLVRA